MNIGIIGFGNLGKAFVKGLLTKQLIKKDDIFICARSKETVDLAIKEYDVMATTDVLELLQKVDLVVFAIKPGIFNDIMKKVDNSLFQYKTIISFMAGVSIKHIRENIKTGDEIVRVMPSLAIANGDGIVAHTKTSNQKMKDLFEGLGVTFEIDENEIDKMTAFAACGLGFAAYLLNSFISSGVELGLDEQTSKKIVTQNFMNVIDMDDFDKTIAAVATKDGATEQGLRHFHDCNITGLIHVAIKKAYEKVNG